MFQNVRSEYQRNRYVKGILDYLNFRSTKGSQGLRSLVTTSRVDSYLVVGVLRQESKGPEVRVVWRKKV